ncbi:DNA-binding protein BIN4-like isoform X3 [Glycine soja]|uniref:DNA-binding protein BIN4-like isoform X3 n=1 Tax=Glycine soja TaxID=3848 RepID=UPI001039C82B|nr:DNA-binding protein BIN4-like isoform X3 [Glycine soja]
MSSSRESSPDWLRSFQAPSHSLLTLSSDSGSSRGGGSWNEDKTDDEGFSPKSSRFLKVTKSTRKTPEAASPKVEEQTPSKRKKLDKKKAKGNKEEKEAVNESNIDKHIDHKESIHSIWTLSSDSESFHDHSPKRDHIDQVETSQHEISDEGECGDGLVFGNDGKFPSKKGSKEKSSQKQIHVEGHTPVKGKEIKASAKGKGSGDLKVEEEETCEKPAEPNLQVSSARLPLMLSEKVQRTKALIECQGDSIDLSGDMGAVGRIIISDSPSGDQEMCLDLKGTIYKTSIVPCRTFCVVSFGQSEAKVEAIMNDFIQLKPQSNLYEAETMVEGTLDGFFFDSDEETGKMQKSTNQTDQNENVEEQANGKSKGKTDKTSGAGKKRGRSTGGKPQAKIAKTKK